MYETTNTTFSYDTENNLTSITDANGHATSFTYDAFGRVTQTTFPSSLAETYAYDAIGNLTSKTDRKGQTITYLYDALNRLTQKTYPDTSSVEYVYDLVGKVMQVNDPTGTYGFAYDNMGRLIGTTTSYSFLPGQTFTNAYTYDAASNRTGFTAPDGSSNSYSYDTLNRLSNLTNSLTGSFGFSYDALSRRTQLTRPNGVNTNYAYDNLSRLLSVLHQAGSTTLDGASYTYDNAGNRVSKTNYLNNVTEGYSYDPLYQLTQVTQGASTSESYSYDAVGNRLSLLGVSPYTYNSSNELTATPSGSYTYDANGNTLSDASGKSYTWDFENRLTQVTVPQSGGGSNVVTFKYDPFGRRIQKSGPLGNTNYLYDRTSTVEEVDSSGNLVAGYAQGQSVDEPFAQLRSGTASYYQQDGLGSVTSLSNSAGGIAETYTFDGYGAPTASTGTLVNPLRYTGRDFDSETGLFYYRARYYDPSVGRFLSEDSLRFERGPNFYSYVGNNPTNWVDPIGHGCYLRTPTGFSEVPCANKCLGNVCHVAAPPLPPLPPSPAAKAYAEALLSLSVMSKCSGERAQEILDIWGEAINGSQNDIAKGRAEDVAVTAGEAAAEHAGLELTEEILSHGAFVLVGYEIYEQIHGYHEFKQRLEETKQHECECYDKAMEKYKKLLDK